MRLTGILLLAAVLQVSARSAAQTVTYSARSAPLAQVLSAIGKQARCNIFYDLADLEGCAPVTVELDKVPLRDALERVLAGEPLQYTMQGSTVVITRVEKKAARDSTPGDPSGEVKGRILNEAGEFLAGANITIKRTGKGTITNVKGEFTLRNVKPDDVLVITFIGFRSQQVPVKGRASLNLVMQVADNQLDKVVIQGYGTTSQRYTTGDYATVTAAEIEKQPVLNPLLALQGKVAGLDVSLTSGYASAPIKIELRGRSSVNPQLTSDPLYIIDGVPLTVLEVGGNSAYNVGSTGFLQAGVPGPANGQSPFFNINPADIESIEVLKDADATSIYGSRGANGVILITTKKGKPGKSKFDLHVQEGIQRVTKYFTLLNTPQYLQMRREAYKNDNLVVDSNSAFDLLQWDTTRYTDWQRALYGGMGRTIDAQASLSGADAANTFRISAGYNRTTEITTVSGADQRGSLSFNLGHRSLDQLFSVSLTGSYSVTKSDMIGIPYGAVTLAPNAPAIYDSAGNLNYAGWGGQNSSARSLFPFSVLKQPYSATTDLLNSNLVFSYKPARGLNVSTSLGYNIARANQQSFTLIASQDPLSNPTGFAQFANNSNKNWIIEPQISYVFTLGRGKFDVLGGATYQQNTTDGMSTSGSGYTNDALIRTIAGAPNQYSSENFGQYRYAALFGRVNYNLLNKYIVNLSVRRDGSSRFGADKQYGSFGALGVAWIFSEENWIKKFIPVLSFGKIRGSYGTTGSDGVGDYQYLTRFSSAGQQPYNGSTSLTPIQHANPNFQWQVNKKLEGAIHLGFFQDRLNLQVAYYRNRVGNQLVPFPTPAFTGFANVTANSPALVQNDGWEFTAGFKLIHTKNFDWTMNFNTAINRNKLIAYPNFSFSPYVGMYTIGKPLNSTLLLHYTGVDPLTGQYTFQDKNHDGTISQNIGPSDDRYVYDLSPKFSGGLGMNFSYRGLQLYLFFNIKEQKGMNGRIAGSNPGSESSAFNNQPTSVLSRWQRPGQVTNVARFTTMPAQSDNFYLGSDGAYSDASFVRLSNLSLSYSLNSSYIRKAGMQSCSLFFHTNNLFIITKYKGIDPETQNFGGLPPTKTIVGGLSVAF